MNERIVLTLKNLSSVMCSVQFHADSDSLPTSDCLSTAGFPSPFSRSTKIFYCSIRCAIFIVLKINTKLSKYFHANETV